MANTSVYKLGPILDDRIYEGFCFPEELESLTGPHGREYDFTHFYPQKLDYKIPGLKRKWDTPSPEDQELVAPFNDFPCCDWNVPVFSQRAIDVLSEFLRPNGEILPLTTSKGQYFAYQTRTIAENVLDVKKSKGDLRDDVPLFSDVTSYVFFKSKLKPYSIFRVREIPSPVFVTDQFRDAVEANGLNGFNFKMVWPKTQTKVNRAARQKRLKIRVDGKLKGRQDETLIVKLPLGSKKLSPVEQKNVKKIRLHLAKRLVLDSPKQKYYGGTEGYEIENGVYHLLLSCPDALRLLQHVADILAKVKWPAEMQIAARKKPFWASGSNEKKLDLTEFV